MDEKEKGEAAFIPVAQKVKITKNHGNISSVFPRK